MKEISYTGTKNGGQETERAAMPSIKVVGVGGGGKNSLNRLLQSNLANLDFIAVNTDARSLNESKGGIKILLGKDMAGLSGFGSASRPGLAKKAALSAKDEIAAALEGAEMVLITATLGGGTGSGASPVIASIAHEMGALVVAFVTRPFRFEGSRRARKARESVKNLKKYVDILFEFKNDALLKMPEETLMEAAFSLIDGYIAEAVHCFIELLRPGLVNIDVQELADIAGGLCEGGIAIGRGAGDNRIDDAIEAIVADKTFKFDKSSSEMVFMNVTAGPELANSDLSRLTTSLHKVLGIEGSMKLSIQIQNEMAGKIKVTLVFLRPRSR